jgi:excisionase family DNA binding protein
MKFDPPSEPPRLDALVVRVPTACRLLACSRQTLYRMMEAGTIRSFRDGATRKVELASLRAYVAEKLAGGSALRGPEK